MKPSDNNLRTVKYQYFATFAANIVTFNFGIGLGWFAPALPMLQSNESPLETGALTISDVSWIGSIVSLGCILGNFLMGYLVTKIGSKHSIALLGIPQLAARLCMIFGTRAIYLYAARFFTGMVGGGVQICISIYVAEIADNDIRGKMGTLYQFTRNFGMLFAFTVGAYFSYIMSAIISSGIIVLFYCIFSFLPSTPHILLQKSKYEEAERAFRFYKGYRNRKESKSYVEEFEQLKNVSLSVKEEPGFKLRDLLEPETRKGMIQALIFPLLNQLCGAYIFLTYGTTIIANSGTHLSSQMSTISLAVVQIIGTFLTLQLVDSKGRKFLLIISLAGCAIGHATMVTYLHLTDHGFDTSAFHFVPVVCMAFVVLISSIGIVPLTLICLVEQFPIKTRSFGITFGNVAINMISFTIVKAFPILTEIIKLQGCLLICCISSTLGVAFMALYVDETKGKDLNVLKNANSRNEATA